MPLTAGEIAERIGARVDGDPETELYGFTAARNAQPGDLTFAENGHYFRLAEQSAASAILVDEEQPSGSKVLIRVAKPRVAFAKVVPLFFPEPELKPGIHPTANVASTATVPASAYVGPYCVIGENVRLGEHAVLHGNNHVGAECDIGDEAHLYPGVVVYARSRIGDRSRIHANTVIGSDGYGYVMDGGRHLKVPQIGYVDIQEDVEIGANVAIDRGALGPTTIGRGSKIDNLVMIGHNVEIGEHCIVVAQAGIAGSTQLGNYVTLAGQTGVAGHLKLGDRAMVAGQSGVMHNIGAGEKWFGSPAQPSHQMKRQLIAQQQLPDLLRRVGELEKQLQEIHSQSTVAEPGKME